MRKYFIFNLSTVLSLVEAEQAGNIQYLFSTCQPVCIHVKRLCLLYLNIPPSGQFISNVEIGGSRTSLYVNCKYYRQSQADVGRHKHRVSSTQPIFSLLKKKHLLSCSVSRCHYQVSLWCFIFCSETFILVLTVVIFCFHYITRSEM